MSALLDRIKSPRDLGSLTHEELVRLCDEIRGLIIQTVSRTGGHLAANLGVVELGVALLRVFDPPRDKVVWDVSHQAYTWKILTGRREEFRTLRQYGGISGFLKREESPYDAFGAGHAGTALSSALGMAAVRDRRGSSEHIVAVLGDAAAGNGISFEALNNLAHTTKRLIVVLNDNEMSISANVGSMSRYLGELLVNPRYNRWKKSVEHLATGLGMGRLRKAYYRTEEAIKGFFLRSVIFEEFGLRYIGPVDGHNLHALLDALEVARQSDRPILVHVSTRKGKGYPFAEQQPEHWHSAAPFDVATGKPTQPALRPGYSQVMGEVLTRIAERDPRVLAITAAMATGTGLAGFAARFPDRFFDAGMCESHALVFAAGMATEGTVPVFAVYSTFLQRAVDCVVHDVCLQKLPVVLCVDRAGIVGDDGPTHHGIFDIAMLRSAPNLVMMQPRDEAELARMLVTGVALGKPVLIRYPRGCGPGAAVPAEPEPLEVGKADVVRPGREVQIWALGDMIPIAERAAELLQADGIAAGVVNPRFIKPMDTALLLEQAPATRVFATIENGVKSCGFGEGLGAFLRESGYAGRTLHFGWPDAFVSHGDARSLFEKHGITAAAVAAAIRKALG